MHLIATGPMDDDDDDDADVDDDPHSDVHARNSKGGFLWEAYEIHRPE